MTRRSLGLMLPPVLMFAVAAATGGPARASTFAAAVTAVSRSAPIRDRATALDQQGRYKKQGDNCVWDANDGGPNQCTPQVKGRFKRGANDSCTWDANDAGPDQCRPPKGRWKKGGDNSCAWNANDDGPDQCNPRQAK
jgi:hypothetical protein